MATTTAKPVSSQVTPPQLEDLPCKDYDPEIASQLMTFVRPYAKRIIISTIFMAISALAGVAGPYLVKEAMDSGIEQGNLISLRNTVLLYLLLQFIQWYFNHTRIRVMAEVGQSIIYDIRARVFEHLQMLSLSFFSRYSVGRSSRA
jgi:ABC-type multidrug transport system fused ATPase/permease subunit